MMLSLSNVTKAYGNKVVTNNTSISFYSNQISFIVGDSGSGKTTLLSLLGGLEDVDEGSIIYSDTDSEIEVKTSNYKCRENHVSFVFQDFNLIDGLSIKKNIEVALNISGYNVDYSMMQTYMNELNLSDVNQSVETLSGGEKQRVAILRAILKGSEIILEDEPTGNLDVSNSDTIFKELSLMKKNRIIIIVTHDISNAYKYGDRILTIKDGVVVKDEKKKSQNSR